MVLEGIDLKSYDKYLVAFSGGKDSTACVLHLLDIGIPPSKIELWHHDIDGGGELFMDWECTPGYCRAFAAAFGIPIYFSGKEGGFLQEMLRNNSLTAPMYFETPEGLVVKPSRGQERDYNTRLKFPQVSPDLSVRWCSAYLKIDVCAAAIRNQKRFEGIKTLVISGERGEESTARSKYADFEMDRAGGSVKAGVERRSPKRWVDRWRPIKDWLEQDVWAIIEKYKVRAHPAYYMGWGRVSCKFCIFGNANQFASAYYVSPKQGDKIIGFENQFGTTIKRNIDLKSLIEKGEKYKNITEELIDASTSYEYTLPVFMDEWLLPAGAYGENCGPV
jgi:3'-phosphoadenosine 5'-phosphosulfate sulfotransferase (PAPS reductase)/FAD synthetase